MESQVNQFCSKCSYERSINDFHVNTQGSRQKTCFRHSKKRAFSEPVTGRWDEFVFEINEWSHPLRLLTRPTQFRTRINRSSTRAKPSD